LILKSVKNKSLLDNSHIIIRNFHPLSKPSLKKQTIYSLVRNVFEKEHIHIRDLELSFVTDKEIRKINRDFLKHDYYTDIITFTYSCRNNEIEGEWIISLDSVKKNAKIYKTGYENELKRVIVHGCLHLAGYKDRTKKEKERIRKKENLYIG
jgi:rRNA maturation RNase YbeY